MSETWRPVPGWPGYEASSRGRLRLVDRQLGDGRQAGGVVLSPSRDGKGYLTVTVSRGGRRYTKRVHVLVALAWLGPPPKRRPQVRHLDGDKDNCAAWNLRYGTQRENEQDKRHSGTRVGRTDRRENRDQEGIRTQADRGGAVKTPGTRP